MGRQVHEERLGGAQTARHQDSRHLTLAQTMEFFDREGHEFVVNSF